MAMMDSWAGWALHTGALWSSASPTGHTELSEGRLHPPAGRDVFP